MQYIGEKICKDKQKIDNLETQMVLLQHYIMTNSSESTVSVSQIINLKAELNSIYDSEVEMKMFNNGIAFYKDYEKLTNSSSKQLSNTLPTMQFKNLNWIMEEL